MPHLTLHLSPALKTENWLDFFQQAHQILSPHAKIQSCKSRINEVSSIYIGQHQGNEALVYLELALLPRPPEVLKTIGDALFEALNRYAAPLIAKHHLQGTPTLEIRVITQYWQ